MSSVSVSINLQNPNVKIDVVVNLSEANKKDKENGARGTSTPNKTKRVVKVEVAPGEEVKIENLELLEHQANDESILTSTKIHKTSKDSAVASASDSISPVPSDGRHQTSPNLFSAIENNNKDDGSSSEDSSSVARSPNLSSFFNGYSMGSSMMSENSSVDEIEATNPLTDTVLLTSNSSRWMSSMSDDISIARSSVLDSSNNRPEERLSMHDLRNVLVISDSSASCSSLDISDID